MKGLHCVGGVALALILAGCADKEVILTGTRIDVRDTLGGEPFVRSGLMDFLARALHRA